MCLHKAMSFQICQRMEQVVSAPLPMAGAALLPESSETRLKKLGDRADRSFANLWAGVRLVKDNPFLTLPQTYP